MKYFGRAMIGFIITWLSIDILYLYYAGGWIEPIRIILISELVMLYALAGLGIFLIGKMIGQASKG